MLPLTGYADRLSVRPLETIRFHLCNATGAELEAKIVRVVCADANPAGPGIKLEPVASTPARCGAATEQRSPQGSHARIDGAGRCFGPGSFSVTCLVHPTRLADARQAIASRTDEAAVSGFVLALDEQGRLCASLGDGTSMRDVVVVSEPLVERARVAGCRLVSSIRDVLQPPSKPSRARAAADRVLASYDAVLVHGDPAFVGLDASFPETERIRDRIRYTGYVAQGPGPDAPPGVGEGEIVVSAGGGVVAHRLVDTALESARGDRSLRWRVLVGPNAGADALAGWRRSAPANAVVEPNRADFRSILSRARASVSQAGYNTVTDLLATGVPAVLVPFSAEGEREQSIRARVLAQAGVARVIDEDRLTAPALLEAVRHAAAQGRPEPRPVRLDGAAESAEAIINTARGETDLSHH